MQDIPNFWDKTHPLSQQSEELFEELVPTSGNCQTLQGELLRASSKIGYDWYNNGWGCNNWSGAVIFLRDHIADLPVMHPDAKSDEFHNAMREIHQFSHGEPADISDHRADVLVTTIHEYVVSKIIANRRPIHNDLDMWTLCEPDFVPEEDDWYDDELDDERHSKAKSQIQKRPIEWVSQGVVAKIVKNELWKEV